MANWSCRQRRWCVSERFLSVVYSIGSIASDGLLDGDFQQLHQPPCHCFADRSLPIFHVPTVTVRGRYRPVVELLQEVGFAISRSEARRLITQGVVGRSLDAGIDLAAEGTRIQAGKRRFVNVVVGPTAD